MSNVKNPDAGADSINRANSKLSCMPVKTEADLMDDQIQLERAGTYELLGSLFAQAPGQEVLDVLRGMDVVDASAGRVAMGWELLRKASLAHQREQIKEEHFNLFVGMGRGELVPFGSWYLTGFLMEKPLSELRSDLKGLGIARQEGVRNSEDHIAGVCDAMAIIIRHGNEIDFDRQKAFFDTHLAPWVGDFFADLQRAEAADFYRAAGFFGEAFADVEREYFAMHA